MTHGVDAAVTPLAHDELIPPAWSTSPELDQLAPALVAALGELDDIARTRTADAGTYRYQYAELADVLAHVRGPLAAHGLAVSQGPQVLDGVVEVTTRVWHISGQWLEAAPLRLPAGNTAQSTGSAITYARRYALMAVLGLAAEDDDGASAAERAEPVQPLLRPDNVERFREAAADANLTAEETADIVLDATGGRTADPAQVYSTERDALRQALDAAIARTPVTPGIPS